MQRSRGRAATTSEGGRVQLMQCHGKERGRAIGTSASALFENLLAVKEDGGPTLQGKA